MQKSCEYPIQWFIHSLAKIHWLKSNIENLKSYIENLEICKSQRLGVVKWINFGKNGPTENFEATISSAIHPWYEQISTANDPFWVKNWDFIWQF